MAAAAFFFKALMKLATLKDGSRDGQLAVVSRDLKTAQLADAIAPALQRALDDWNFFAPQLDDLYAQLNAGRARRAFAFDPAQCMAPLPRAYQWLDASAYTGHLERMKLATGVDWVALSAREPLIYQGGSDDFLGGHDDVPFVEEEHGIDFEAEIAVVTGNVPMGVKRDDALEHVRLLMLVNDWSLRNLGAGDLKKQFGFFLSKPATAFAAVAVTPDELGEAWRDGRAAIGVRVDWNGVRFGTLDAGADTRFGFGELIAFAARTRNLRPGSVLGLGTISQISKEHGFATIAEARAQEKIDSGAAHTAFMKYGDRVRIEAFDAAGQPVFGAIDQTVVSARRRRVVQVVAGGAEAGETAENEADVPDRAPDSASDPAGTTPVETAAHQPGSAAPADAA